MLRQLIVGVSFVAASALPGCAHLSGGQAESSRLATGAVRFAAIRQAQVWSPIDVSSADIKTGPVGEGAFAPNATVTCNYVEKKMGGHSPKFLCEEAEGDQLKVKYGQTNGEVFAEVAASRLFWALGFGANRVYPVRVICHGCPSSLGGREGTDGQRSDSIFEYASVERWMSGRAIETRAGPGWEWSELDFVDEKAGGASRAQRDALKLLAVFVQHTDSKREQQVLLCLGRKERQTEGGPGCAESFMFVADLGQTFGRANTFNRDAVGSVNLSQWKGTPIWKDPKRCVANLSRSVTGTLENPVISEAGRRFLADLLMQLSDAQVRDLFETARFADRTTGGKRKGDAVEGWVTAFEEKRTEIVNHTCPM